VTVRWEMREKLVPSILIAVLVPLVIGLAMWKGTLSILVVGGLIAAVTGGYVLIRHPLWLYWALAVVMATLPFGRIPGAHLPMYLPLTFICLVAAVVHPRIKTPMSPVEKAVVVQYVVSALSMVVMATGITDLSLFIRWSMGTLTLFSLLQLSAENLARFGRIFVYGATANAIFGIYIFLFDHNQSSFRFLRVFGYIEKYTSGFLAYADGGQWSSVRLGGTWVEPNGAGFNLIVATAMCVVLFTGRRRAVMATILMTAMVLTLSRSSLLTTAAAVIILLTFHTLRARNRMVAIAAVATAAAAIFLAPPVRHRLLTSLAAGDAGANDRRAAFLNFPHAMQGHWAFGVGWGVREFWDPTVTYSLVSNAPMLSTYRGGILCGLAFVGVLATGCVLAYRAIRTANMAWAIYGSFFIGYTLVMAQLDHLACDSPQPVVTFAIFLAFLVSIERARKLKQPQLTNTGEFLPKRTGPPLAAGTAPKSSIR
jgi:polysaccharide biosynthesis protein PslJ